MSAGITPAGIAIRGPPPTLRGESRLNNWRHVTNLECAVAYRRLADLLEANPEMPQPYQGSENSTLLVFCNSKESLAAAVRAFGAGKKQDGGDTIDFVPDFPLNIVVMGFKHACCAAIQTKRIVPAMVIPARPALPATEERLVPEHEETVTEYVCAPILEVQS